MPFRSSLLIDLHRLNNLKVLDVSGTPLSDLSPLATLGKLEGLVLRRTEVEDLSPLVKLDRLKVLRLFQSRVTDQEAAKLQEMLPNCRIDRRL